MAKLEIMIMLPTEKFEILTESQKGYDLVGQKLAEMEIGYCVGNIVRENGIVCGAGLPHTSFSESKHLTYPPIYAVRGSFFDPDEWLIVPEALLKGSTNS